MRGDAARHTLNLHRESRRKYMELRQLEYFKTIVEMGSISEAARRLHMSQPPLSFQMKKLEEETGTQLFIRGRRSITLTEAGSVLYARALQMLSMADAVMHETRRAGSTRTLYIGMTPSTIPTIGRYLREFSLLHPDVRYQIRDGSTFQLKHMLDRHEIEAAVLRSPVPTEGMDVILLGSEPMVAAVPRELLGGAECGGGAARCGELQEISLERLAAFPLSTYRRYLDLFTDCFEKKGLSPDFFSVCDDVRTTLMWVEQGCAAALFPEALLRQNASDVNSFSTGNAMFFRISEPALDTNVLLMREKGSAAERSQITVLDEFWEFMEKAR